MPSVSRHLVPPPAGRTYFPLYYPGKITLFDPMEGSGEAYHDPYMGWQGLAAEMEVHVIPGDRYTIFKEPNVQVLAERLSDCLDNLSK